MQTAVAERIVQGDNKPKDFLYPHQKEALTRMFNGCILRGGTGSGKSRCGLYYYFQKYGGKLENREYTPMRPNPPDLYIISTAKKCKDKEWNGELTPFLLLPDPKTGFTRYGNKIVIDSWNVVKKYVDVKNAFFIFDECKINGKGVWSKSFLEIAKYNEWIILSATPGDTWQDYATVFIAHGFFRNRTEFNREHVIFSNYAKFPQVTGYRNETRLVRLRDRILVDMEFERHTVQIHEDVWCDYNLPKYKEALKTRWDPYANEPITQAAGLCSVLRRIVNTDESRQVRVLELMEEHPRVIIFYSFNYELEILLNLAYPEGTIIAQYNGSIHQELPKGERWVYLVQYNACEAWNAVTTDTIIFFSQTYSYKTLLQASGRIDRLTTPYSELHYYHLRSRASIDLAIKKALSQKKKFNERKFAGFDK